jgi:hypothetical protein
MSLWIIAALVIVGYLAFLAFIVALCRAAGKPTPPPPPTRPRLRVVKDREHVGHVEFLPNRHGDR